MINVKRAFMTDWVRMTAVKRRAFLGYEICDHLVRRHLTKAIPQFFILSDTKLSQIKIILMNLNN